MVGWQTLLLAAAISGTSDTTMLEFSSPYCGPCKSMEPVVRRLADAGYPIRQIDVSRDPDSANAYRIRAVPCFVLVHDGREVDRFEGATSYERLVEMFDRAGASPDEIQNERMEVRGQSPVSLRDRLPVLNGLDRLRSLAQSATSGSQPADMRQPAGPAIAEPPTSAAVMSRASTFPERPESIRRLALQASVRLRVSDPQGHSFGTGTIIDSRENEALVLTCGHLFRDSQGRGAISVEMFVDGAARTVPGELIAYDAGERDIALVAFRPGAPVSPIPVAPAGFRPSAGDAIFSIGCDRGADPSIRESRIVAVDRYLNSPNIVIAGQPVDGRSGGGLFTSDGLLIGVCNNADPSADEGIYRGLPTIHEELDRNRLAHVYQRHDSKPENAVVSVAANNIPANASIASSADDRWARYDQIERNRQPSRREAAAPTAPSPRDDGASSAVGSGNEYAFETDRRRAPSPLDTPRPLDPAMSEPASASMLGAAAPMTSDGRTASEVIVIVQSRENPDARRMLVVDRPSRELLDRLESESRMGAAQQFAGRPEPFPGSGAPSPRSNGPLAPARENVIRAQQ